jgi:hypothetical protein
MAKVQDFIALLEGVIEDVIPADDALRRWPDVDADRRCRGSSLA